MISPLNQFLPKGFREPKNVIKYFSEIESLDYSLTNVSGIYIIFSREQEFVYPNGQSRVIYIGKSDNLRKRIGVHFNAYNRIKSMTKAEKIGYWTEYRYFYMDKFDAGIAWFTTRGTQTSKQLETNIMEFFYDRYLSLPVGNGAFSY
jgi:hypothetical protein